MTRERRENQMDVHENLMGESCAGRNLQAELALHACSRSPISVEELYFDVTRRACDVTHDEPRASTIKSELIALVSKSTRCCSRAYNLTHSPIICAVAQGGRKRSERCSGIPSQASSRSECAAAAAAAASRFSSAAAAAAARGERRIFSAAAHVRTCVLH